MRRPTAQPPTNPWLPSAAATLLKIAANPVMGRVEARKK
ncbi:hypothetical protein SALBM135S_05609 [Streptomyces alboniger]